MTSLRHWHATHQATLSLGERLADRVTHLTGSFNVFMANLVLVLVWGATGPLFHFSDTWQLVINTGTTIITYLMVFLIQNNFNRQADRDRLHAEEDYRVNLDTEHRIEALQIAIARIETDKLDEILRLIRHADRFA